ncbi:hypothetical protein [Phascolarctobacterium succinatutens]|uniref:hypothetical protein n=1 Tax=Phascolarctobacterium succinatutens TaxID=626940 RepID=UPI0026F0C8D7|nr:hypothetical protein [Phascolarctobacterium succinatutens]
MKKFLVIPSLCALLLSAGLAEQAAFAAENVPAQEKQQAMLPPDGKMPPLLKDGKRPPLPPRMRRPQLSNAEAAAKLQEAYGYRYSEMLRLLNNGHSYGEMKTACLYAYLSGAPVEKVLQLRQPATWGRVRVQLGLTPKVYAERYMQYQASYLPADSSVDRTTALQYLQQGYPLSDILQAGRLVQRSGRSIAEILPLRTVTCDWTQVEQKLGLAQAKGKDAKPAFGRGQRSGAGFAGLHTRNMTKERAVRIFHNDYLFAEEELGRLYDKYGFNAAEDICLHAYMAKKPLAEIESLRDKYSWERMKYVLGLTPEVYFERCVDYQARRLAERMDIPRKVTKKYMHLGYAMHHINSAYLLAQKAGLDISKVIDLKTPKNSWSDVAAKIGVSEADCQAMKDKISKDFGRHA